MSRMVLASAASLLLLGGCADRYNYEAYPDGQAPWRMTRNGNEIDYELLDQVLFRNDSADLSDHASRVIAALADEARHQHRTLVVVDGYTDTTGTPEHNLDLSRARADTVAEALRQEGISDHRIETHGFGETHLAVPTPDQVSEPRNRRVVIRLMPV
ncbi:MAG: OmpA family protein [Rhizomicrobium sp.]